MSKEKKLSVYLQAGWEFPVKLTVKPDGVQMGTVFLTWEQNDVLIKMLKTAKTMGRLIKV